MLFLISLFNCRQASAQQFLTTIDGWNAYVHLPDDYNDSVTKRYPLIIFIPGLGEVGTDPSKLLVYGPSKFLNEGYSMNFLVNGKIEKPIVISIQPASAWPTAYSLNRRIDSMLLRYRVDAQRISGTGLSMGAWAWDNYVDGYDPIYTNRMAAVVAMSAPEPDNTVSNMRLFAQGGAKWWGFEGNMDLRGGDKIRDTMNLYVPGSARYTLYNGNHCCWNSFYVPTYTENGESVYTWMLKQKRPGTTFAIPQANAGNDSVITAPVSSLTLTGSGNDPVGNPISFTWTKVSGPATGTITAPASAQTSLSGLGTGIYQFELKVINNMGGIGKDTITIKNGNSVLPVKLIELKAIEMADHISLQWKTNTEINSSRFIVERSTEGTSFSTIGTVAAAGNSSGDRFYQFNDVTATRGMNFYRLRMMDLDDSSAYSKVVNVDIKNIKLVPTIVSAATYVNSNLNLRIDSRVDKLISFTLTDPMGRVLYKSNIPLISGSNQVSKIIPSAKGIYYASFTDNDGRITKTILNQ